jgi:nucleotide-binding universal stress UspA family protein
MFTHILVPTDGTKLSAKAVKTAVKLAKSTGARLTGLYVVAPYYPALPGEAFIGIPGVSSKQYKRVVQGLADKALAEIRRTADAYGVPSTSITGVGGEPWRAILRTARGKRCDLIVMASHGRSGLTALVIGSETNKVLAHSKLPVLVCR